MAGHRHLEWFPHQTTSLCGQTSLTINFKRKPPRFEMAVAVNIMLISNDSVSKRYKCLITHNILTSGYYVTDSWGVQIPRPWQKFFATSVEKNGLKLSYKQFLANMVEICEFSCISRTEQNTCIWFIWHLAERYEGTWTQLPLLIAFSEYVSSLEVFYEIVDSGFLFLNLLASLL